MKQLSDLTNKKIIKLHDRLPELRNRLHSTIEKTDKLLKRQTELLRVCQFIGKITEVYEGVPLEIGKHFAHALNAEYTRYAYYRISPGDAELKPKNMRWMIDFIDHPPANPDGTTNHRVAGIIMDIKNEKIAIDFAKKWIVLGDEWLDDQNGDRS